MNKLVEYLVPFIVSVANIALADTRDQIRTNEMQEKFFGNNFESAENKKMIHSWSSEQIITSKDLGVRSRHIDPEDRKENFQAVLRVKCADSKDDFLPNIPRNRPVTWTIQKDSVTLNSGSAHVDSEGYVRFIVPDMKSSMFKKMKVSLNSEDIEVDRNEGPFDLVYKRTTCMEKKNSYTLEPKNEKN
ncbi:MAG: hypothetical protein JNL11_11715 [Bdellovibrionaceae bacterium]|nr:hypothetical protein [Pseudobdellovibrionaceae bacterium]